jgi:sugar phosphate isomerase/epimerase
MPRRLSFQLYSARNMPSLADTLAMVAKIGYREVEGFGAIFGDPRTSRAMLDDTGLTMPTGHFGLDLLERTPAKAVTIATTLGIRHIYAPYVAADQRPKTAAGWRKFGRRLAAIGQWARSEGFAFGWHNHDFEHLKLASGETPHELIFAAAPLLDWEMDVAWVIRAGANPLALIRKYADRITAAHIKDIARRGENLAEDGWEDVGFGTVTWRPIFAALKNSRTLHYVLEHDNPSDVERFARRSFRTVRKI